jgi:hypothetical protein
MKKAMFLILGLSVLFSNPCFADQSNKANLVKALEQSFIKIGSFAKESVSKAKKDPSELNKFIANEATSASFALYSLYTIVTVDSYFSAQVDSENNIFIDSKIIEHIKYCRTQIGNIDEKNICNLTNEYLHYKTLIDEVETLFQGALAIYEN